MANVAFGLSVGNRVPHDDVVILREGKRKVVEFPTQLSGKDVLIFIPGAFTKVCSETHVPSFQTDEWEKTGYKIHVIASDTINVLEEWKAKHGWTCNMISNCNHAFGKELLFNDPTLGRIFKRASAIIDDGVIKQIHVEIANAACTVSHGDNTLKQMVG